MPHDWKDFKAKTIEQLSPPRVIVGLLIVFGMWMLSWLDRKHALGWVPAMAWPTVVLIFGFAFRIPLSRLLEGLGQRITKLSLFKVELELTKPERLRQLSDTVLEDVREPAATQVDESGPAIFKMLESRAEFDYAVINLGAGDEWITSRLFITAAMLKRMHHVSAIVFLEGAEGKTFAGWALVDDVISRLGSAYPWLQLAYVTAESQLRGGVALNWQTISQLRLHYDAQGGLQLGSAQQLVADYLRQIREDATIANPSRTEAEGWMQFANTPKWERAKWVTPIVLQEVLGTRFFGPTVSGLDDVVKDPVAQRVAKVVKRRGRYVAITDHEGRFLRLLDRPEILEEIAATYIAALEAS
jgi:hypothetical protein